MKKKSKKNIEILDIIDEDEFEKYDEYKKEFKSLDGNSLQKILKNRGVKFVDTNKKKLLEKLVNYKLKYPNDDVYVIYDDGLENKDLAKLIKIMFKYDIDTSSNSLNKKYDYIYHIRYFMEHHTYNYTSLSDLKKIAKSKGISSAGKEKDIVIRLKAFNKFYNINKIDIEDELSINDGLENLTKSELLKLAKSHSLKNVDKDSKKYELLYVLRKKGIKYIININNIESNKKEEFIKKVINNKSYGECRKDYEIRCNEYIKDILDVLNVY